MTNRHNINYGQYQAWESNRMNNYAITSEGIGSALERSASTLVAAGNDLDQSIALITAGNIITQDPESVGKIDCQLNIVIY